MNLDSKLREVHRSPQLHLWPTYFACYLPQERLDQRMHGPGRNTRSATPTRRPRLTRVFHTSVRSNSLWPSTDSPAAVQTHGPQTSHGHSGASDQNRRLQKLSAQIKDRQSKT
uniref:Uncharacterized protein n=1 Tax=Arundo donax TaxID=35708 RepID=A0A0A8XWB2_ARUDO